MFQRVFILFLLWIFPLIVVLKWFEGHPNNKILAKMFIGVDEWTPTWLVKNIYFINLEQMGLSCMHLYFYFW